jgi:hypothetical protein
MNRGENNSMRKMILIVLAFAILGVVPMFAQSAPSPNPVSTTLNFSLNKNESLSMSAAWAGGPAANVFTMALASNDSDVLGINISGTWNLKPSRSSVDYCFNLTGVPTNTDGVTVPVGNFFAGTTATPATQLSAAAADCGATAGAKQVASVPLTNANRNVTAAVTNTFLQVQGAAIPAGSYTGGVLTIYAFAN